MISREERVGEEEAERDAHRKRERSRMRTGGGCVRSVEIIKEHVA